MLGRGAGLRAHRLGSQADFLQGARLRDDQVVRHQIGVLEDDLDRLARLDDDPFLVEEHLIGHGADADHAHAQLAQLLADDPGLLERQGVGE